MTVKPIAVSFKNTPEDKELYEWIISHSNMSGFVKDILREVKKGEKGGSIIRNKAETKDNKMIDLGF